MSVLVTCFWHFHYSLVLGGFPSAVQSESENNMLGIITTEEG